VRLVILLHGSSNPRLAVDIAIDINSDILPINLPVNCPTLSIPEFSAKKPEVAALAVLDLDTVCLLWKRITENQ
jgi:hypothetical protein